MGGPSAPGPSELMLGDIHLISPTNCGWVHYECATGMSCPYECLPRINTKNKHTGTQTRTQIQNILLMFLTFLHNSMKPNENQQTEFIFYIKYILTLDIYCLQVLLESAYFRVWKS